MDNSKSAEFSALRFNVSIKFPNGMSDRDKQIILDEANQHFAGKNFESEEQAQIALQAYLGEFLLYSTRKIN